MLMIHEFRVRNIGDGSNFLRKMAVPFSRNNLHFLYNSKIVGDVACDLFKVFKLINNVSLPNLRVWNEINMCEN